MDTLFSNVVATIRGVINSGKKIIVASILVSLLLSNVPVMVPTAQAQASGYSGPTGYETANDIEKAVTGAATTAEGPLKDTVNSVLEYVGRFLANIFLLFSRLLLKMASFMIDFIMVIAGYNAYIDSTAVNVGWTVVRDITNMLFIVILLVISFATILGLEGYEWKQLLPKLVSAAILVNFSRTICGLLIDASQVIMMTFLNAVSATIGGNIINAFRLPTFEAFHANVQSQQLTSSGILSAAALALFFSGLVTATLGAYVFILLGRLIRLWVLIVLSPLAFVLGILPATSGMSSKWWSELADNLITGPVIMFFIWLSLIVVGTGQANQELVKGSRMADKSPIEQAFGPQEQMLTPTDIGGWNNLANFVIAIGMLFAGAKVASSIGGSSGNLLEAGLDFGKKVALAGLGYGLIRSVGDRTASASRSMAGKASDAVFGTLAKPFVRAKKITGSFLAAQGYRAEEWRNTKAKETEEERQALDAQGKLGGLGGSLTSMYMRGKSWALSSENRLDNNVKKWEALAAEKKKQAEESYGTSNWKAGTSLEREKIRTERLVAESDKSKALKDAQRRMEFSGGVSWVAEELNPQEKRVAKLKEEVASLKGSTDTAAYNKAMEELSVAEDGLNTARERTEKELRKKYAGNKKVDPDYILEYYDKGKNLLRKSAEAEHLNHIMHNNDAMAVARQKDNLMIEEGKPHLAVFEHQEHARQEKERRDLLSTGNFDLAMAKIEQVRDKISENQGAIAKLTAKISGSKDAAEIKNFENQLVQLEHKGNEHMVDMARLMSANAARGSDFLSGALSRATAGMKLAPVQAGDVSGQQALHLSSILHRDVKPENVEQAFKELSGKMGGSFDAFMESFNDSLNNSAAGGSVNDAGLFRGVYDVAENKMQYHVVNMNNKDDADWSKAKRDYALAQSNINKINSFASSLDRNVEGKVMAVTEEAVRRFAEKFGPATENQVARIEKTQIDEMKNMFKSMNAEQNRNLIAAMATQSRNVDSLKALLARIGNENVEIPPDSSGKKVNMEAFVESLYKNQQATLEQVLSTVKNTKFDLGAASTSSSSRSSRPAV